MKIKFLTAVIFASLVSGCGGGGGGGSNTTPTQPDTVTPTPVNPSLPTNPSEPEGNNNPVIEQLTLLPSWIPGVIIGAIVVMMVLE